MSTMHCYICHVSLDGDTCPECGRVAVVYDRAGGKGYDMVDAEDLAAGDELYKSLTEPQLCSGCGIYPADLPSQLCAGCEAYQEHTAI